MTAASPAKPPPTTIILGAAICVRSFQRGRDQELSAFSRQLSAKAQSKNYEPEGMGGVKRNGAATRFQKLIWPMAVVRKASSRSEKCAETRENDSSSMWC